MEAKEWDAVLSYLEELMAQTPDFRDTGAKLEEVRKHKEEALQRQTQLEELYNRAVKHTSDRQRSEGRQLLIQIQNIEPSFRDIVQLLNKV